MMRCRWGKDGGKCFWERLGCLSHVGSTCGIVGGHGEIGWCVFFCCRLRWQRLASLKQCSPSRCDSPAIHKTLALGCFFLVLTFLHFLWLTFLLLILWWIVCLGLVRHSEDSNRAKHPKHPTRTQIPWPYSAELGAFALAFCRWMNLAVVGAWNCYWLLLLGIHHSMKGKLRTVSSSHLGLHIWGSEAMMRDCDILLLDEPTNHLDCSRDGSWLCFFLDFGDGSWWKVQVSQKSLVFFVVFFWLQQKEKLASFYRFLPWFNSFLVDFFPCFCCRDSFDRSAKCTKLGSFCRTKNPWNGFLNTYGQWPERHWWSFPMTLTSWTRCALTSSSNLVFHHQFWQIDLWTFMI